MGLELGTLTFPFCNGAIRSKYVQSNLPAAWFGWVLTKVRGISAASGLERYVEQLRQLLQVVLGSDTDWLESPFLLRVQRAMQALLDVLPERCWPLDPEQANFQDKFTVHAPALKLGLRQAGPRNLDPKPS